MGFALPAILARLTSDVGTASFLSKVGRLVFIVVIPVAITLILDQRCGARWLLTWRDCVDDPLSFTTVVDLMPPGWGEEMLFTVIHHDDVCSPAFDVQGSCARGVIVVMGDLLFAQLLSSTFVSTAISLVKETSTVKRAKSTAKSTLRRSKEILRGSTPGEEEDI